MLVTTLNEDMTEVNDMRLLYFVFSWIGSDAVISIFRFDFSSLLSFRVCLCLADIMHVILKLVE